MKKALVLTAILVLLCIVVGCESQEQSDCELKFIGYTTTIIPSGKTMIPIQQPIYTCVERRE